MTPYRCDRIELPDADLVEEVTRADLVFYGVDHSGVSYEGQVYIDPPGDDPPPTRDPGLGYAGSFTIFGHAGCYGDAGHCLPNQGFRDEFDRRPRHPLTPFTRTVVVTDAIRRAMHTGATEISVTVVASVPPSEGGTVSDQPMRIESVRLLTYHG